MKLWSLSCRRKQDDTNFGETGPKNLNILDIIVIGLGSSLGIGISVLIGGLIKNVTGPAVVVSIFLAGVTALIGGLCGAEFGVRFYKVDSVYAYSYFWGGENFAFIFGWALILEYVAGIASVAKGITTFTDALSDSKVSDFLRNSTSTDFPKVSPYFDFLSLGIVVIITIIVVFQAKDSLVVKKLFTLCNVFLIAFVIIGGTFNANVKNWQTEKVAEIKSKGFAPFGALNVIRGAAIAFYGFIGCDTASIYGEEIKKRKKNLPLSIFIDVMLVLVGFVGVGVTLTLMLPYGELNAFAAAPIAFQQAGWISFKWLVAVATFFGFQTSLFGVVFSLPKIIRAMANDGLLCSCLGICHSKFKTPVMASLIGGLIAAAAAGIFPFQILVNLTVVGALFKYTALAISLIILRYSSTFENDEKMTDSWKNLIDYNAAVSMKVVMQNCFNFREKHPTKLSKIIITGNLVLFCISSAGLSIIFNVFYEYLPESSVEVAVPSSILLSIMLFNLISMICQPKSQNFIPLKVSLVPFLPCLSIFLNIFFLVSFESLTWILFSSWMAIGITLHFSWRFLKCLRGEIAKSSLYDINKTNVVKLNESIWKIKSNKKSFYEGAVNPVFSDDLENKSSQVVTGIDGEDVKLNEKISFQLKQAEIIQTAESVMVERVEPLEDKLETNFILVSDAETGDRFPEVEEEEKVHWECVAEIHTEQEFSQESVALEIVNETYNFLSEISEDKLKNNFNSKEISEKGKSVIDSKIAESDTSKEIENSVKDLVMSSLDSHPQLMQQKYVESKSLNKSKHQSFKEELLSKIELRMNNKKIKETDFESLQPPALTENRKNISEDSQKFSKDSLVSESALEGTKKNQEQFINLIVETFYKPRTSQMILHENKPVVGDTAEAKAADSFLDEQNKKEFKEKLNQLLKEQVNSGASLSKNSPKQFLDTYDTEKNKEKKDEEAHNTIKTLNKSQIKGKLELLLSKGPPKRPSLGSSFNLKINESDKDSSKLGGTKDETLNIQSNNISGNLNEEKLEKTSDSLPIRENEKMLSLNDVGKLPNDVGC